MAAVNQVVDETVFRYRTEGVEDATRKVDGLASAQEGLASANDGATASSERAERRVRTMADAQAIAQRQLEATLRLTEQMDRANGAYGQSVAAAAANENKAAVDRASALATVGAALKETAKLALEHPIIFGAAASMSARALSGLAVSAATSLASASAATARYANDNTAMGGKVAAAANVASRGLATTSSAASAAAGGLATFADKTSSATTILFGSIRAVRLLAAAFLPLTIAVAAFELASKAMDKAYADLERLVALGQRAEKLDVSGPFLKSFEGLGAKVRAETAEMEAALKQASGFVEAQFGGDRLAKLVADIAAQTGGAALRAAQQIDLAQGTEERIRAALAAMVELEAHGQRLAAIDLGEKVFGATFVERVRRGQVSFAQIAADLNGLRDRELIRQEDVVRAVALGREIEDVKGEISKAMEVTFDFSAAAMMVDKAWLSVLKTVRDVAVSVDKATRPGEAGAQRYIERLQALANEIETISIPMQLDRGNLDVVESLRQRLAGLRDEIDRLSPSLKNAERAIDESVGRVPPALPVMSDELAQMRVAAEAAAGGLDRTGASAAAAGAQLAAAAAKAHGFAAALNAIQAANPNLASTISLMGQIGDVQKKVAEGSADVLKAFDAGKITDPEAQQLLKKLNDDAAESIKALRTEAEKPWKSYAREAELGGMKDLDQSLARAGDRFAETRKQAEAYYQVQIERATPEARGALEKERAKALAGIDAAFKQIEATTRNNGAEKGARDAGKAAKEAEKDFDGFKSKAEEAFKKLFPADALRKQGEELQKELDKFRDQLNAVDPRLVASMEAKIKLNLDGKEVEGIKEQTDELAKEMSGAFRGVFDEMFSAGNKGFAGLADGLSKSLSRIGTRMLESTFLTPLFSGKEGGSGGFSLGGLDFDKLQKAVGEGSFDGIKESFGDLLKPGSGGAKGTGFASTRLGGGLMSAGVGAAIGYQSQSPVVGALGGALAGSSFGPWGAVIGAGAGLLGGLFGKSQAKKEAQKKLREQLEAYKEAYRQAEPEIKKLQSTFRGESLGNVGEQIDAAFQQMYQANKTASQAGDQPRADQLARDFEAYALRLRDQFMRAFEGTLSEVSKGFGTSGPFAQANAAVAALGESLKAFVKDAESLPEPEKNGPRARAAAQQAALAALDPPKTLSDTQSRLAAIQGTAAGLSRVLQDLGMSAGDAATAIRDRTAVAMKALRAEFSADLKSRTNEATGKGYLNEAADLIKERDALLADARAIGAGTADVSAYFKAAAQKIVDGSELTGDAFTALVRQFPALKGAVVEFGQAIDTAAAKAEAAARALGYQDRAFAAGTDTSMQAGALAAFDRKAAQDRAAEAKAGGQAMADLEKALAAERTAIIKDFAAQAAEAEKAAAEAVQRRALSAEDRLFAARNDAATLTGKLAELDRQHAQERLDEVAAGGQALAKLEAAQAAERLKIVREAGEAETAARKQALAEAQTFLDGQAKSIRSYLDNLKAGPDSTLSPGARLKEAQAQYAQQYKLAKGGDRDALSSLTQYADRYLDAAKGMYASGPAYQKILDKVTGSLSPLPKQVSAEQFIVDAIQAQTKDLKTTIATGSASEIAKALKGDFAGLDANTDGLLSQKEFLNALGPKATLEEQRKALLKFAEIDLNGDGQLSKLELLITETKGGLAAIKPSEIAKAVTDSFATLDLNKDKQLSMTEYLKGLGPLTKEQTLAARKVFYSMDKDRNSFVSEFELVGFTIVEALKANSPTKIATALKDNFPTIDVNSDGGISLQEYKEALGPLATEKQQQDALKVFNSIDRDGNGTISYLEALRTSLGSNLTGINTVSKAVNDNFTKLDKNGSGGLSLKEFKAAFVGLATQADQKLAEEYFKSIDTDGNDIITKLELVAQDLLTGIKNNSPTDIASALKKNFPTIDVNSDGGITYEEMVKALGPKATKADQDLAKKVFDSIDLDGDKIVTKAEAVRKDLLNQLVLNDPAKMALALSSSFSKIDLNNDKQLTMTEYLKSLGTLTKAQTDEARKVFYSMDKDRNSFVSQFELVGFAIVQAVKANEPEKVAKALKDNFPTIDVNNDNAIDWKEFSTAIGPLSTKQQQIDAKKVFDAIDLDGDGVIKASEAVRKDLLDQLKLNDPAKMATALSASFAALDKNSDKQLSMTEYLKSLGPLTQAQTDAARKVFYSMDRDRNSFLSQFELVGFAIVDAIKANEPAKVAEALKNNFPKIDVNNDNAIDWKEFSDAIGPLATKQQQVDAKKIFDNIDADGNNVITAAEAIRKDLLDQLKLNDPAKMAAALSSSFATLDLNKDKLLTMTEYLKGLGPLTQAQTDAARKVFYSMDKDRDSFISQFELVGFAIVDAVKANSPTKFAEALSSNFDTLNTTVDGVLDENELKNAIKGLSTTAEQQAATSWIKTLDTNNNKQLDKQEIMRLRLVDVQTNTGNTKDAVDKGKTATDSATTAVKDGNTVAGEVKRLLDSLKTLGGETKLLQDGMKKALVAIQGYQQTSDENLRLSKLALDTLKTSGKTQEDQLKLLIKQYTLATPITVAGTKYTLNNGMLDALNKIVFNTGQTVSGLIKLMSVNKPDGLGYVFAEGGWVRGPGTGTSDSIGARLSNGEFVVNAASARMNAGLLEAMNDNRAFSLPTMPVPVPVQGGGMDVGALIAELRALRAEQRDSRAERKALLEMVARVTKAGSDKVAGKVEETTDEVAGQRDDNRKAAAPMRAGRGEPVKGKAA